MSRRLLAFALLLLALPASPQTKLVESIEVRVANIDVVVRDKAGKPITGLTKDDFELYENGVRQTITNLYEVRRDTAAEQTADTSSPAVPIEVRQRRLLLFVDSASLLPSRKKQVLAAATKFIDRLQPEDQAMLVTWQLGLHVVTPFTSDKQVLQRGIAALERFAPVGESSDASLAILKREIESWIYQASTAGSRGVSWQAAYAQSVQLVDHYSERLLREQARLLEALDRMVADFAGLEGKKALLLVTQNLPERPGAELFRYVQEQFAPHMNRQNPLDMQFLTGAMGNSRPQEIERVASRASANGITIYAIDPAESGNDLLDASSGAMQEGTSEGFSRHANTTASLNTMAEVTGGVAVTQTSNFDLAFDTIGRDLDSYYSLGYKPVGEGSLNARKIVVKTKDRSYRVRSRESLVVKSTDEQMSDRVIANLFTDAAASTWPISVRLGKPRPDGKAYLVPVEVVMPSTITLLPQEQNVAGAFMLYFVVGGADGRTSGVLRSPHNLRMPASAEALIRAKPMTFTTSLRVAPGESTLSVAVIDEVSGATGYARTKILAR
jgi:VWFA-related protein